MLAWRAISRPPSIARRGLQAQRRLIRSSAPRAQYQARPDDFLSKVRYRTDGKPRSKLIGITIGSLFFLNALTLLTMYDLVEDSEMALGLLASMIYIQQTDLDYNAVDLDDRTSTLEYFKRLYQSFSRIPPDEVDDIFKDLSRLMKSGGSNAEMEAHRIMRTAAEKIHVAFQELNQDSISNTANFVLLVLKDALEGLIDLVEDQEDDDSDTKYTFQLIRDHTKKDAGVLKDYEVLG
ncbi:hypothetical protein B0H34DRAFT_4405 [Crassisporium funariophilum]|nr:hypothetical protein B0H34DRAFT_4405 [Crassisporium funariophilum]